jgi:hypothetical protein
MKTTRWEDLKRRKHSPEKLQQLDREVEQELLEMDFRAIRELLGKSQVEVAGLMDMTQPEISKLEQRADYRMSTLRRFVLALGGELEVVAKFGDRQVRLRATG